MSRVSVSEANDHLVELLKARSSEAFACVYDQYAGALYGFICRTVSDADRAEALLQDVFIRMWREIDLYDPSKERLFTWLFRLTLNACGETAINLNAVHL